jgi:hypothetical protein
MDASTVNSKQQLLDNDEIISIAALNTGGEYSAEQVKASLAAEARNESQKAILIRNGNTLFVLYRDKSKPHFGMFRALNADTPDNYVNNSLMFLTAAKSMGFTALVTEFDDPTLLNLFTIIGRNPPSPNMGYRAYEMDDGSYQAVIDFGIHHTKPRKSHTKKRKKR